ncbi:RagB/SusD family nutrient uptake outer membrane protein [Rhodocytophaga aerolata]|uniref:RagB/SusD family nutrient uptake outer membrane protein n=1 Tax=Rhodocytophaga aerolata TaxID=455078 RepID=A0ABT8R2C1_9BACT|nr:RagB/SusD family nutrient uptake outer membrane protein [Rhodocytophaga aerolata]MDO1444790.1 RagB/SusD family nutrient uptake outer membrane protein [Rhodocytophaga aerolata]
MNKYIKKGLILTGCTIGLFMGHACTDLEEEVYDQTTPDSFGQTPGQLNALIGPLYSGLGDYYGNMAEINTVTDEQIVPTRGGDWEDGGRWRRFHQHTWDVTLDDGTFNGIWNWIYNNITRINFQLADENLTNEQTIAELRTLRAFYHYIATDMFGNVIIADRVGGDSPAQKTRTEVYTWVEQELVAAIPNLSEETGGVNYGRMNKYVAHMILGKLYLNAQVYTGTPQWAKVIEQMDAIINSNKYSLPADFFSTFAVQNQNSPEIILATPMDATKRGGFNPHMRTLHYLNQTTYNLGAAPWNGFATMAEFYNSYEDTDQRKDGWIVGQQFNAKGEPLVDDGQPLIFSPEIPALVMPAGPAARRAGARFKKYEIQVNNKNNDQSNDFVIFRLADALLMRAEAQFRLGNTAAALTDINRVRERAYGANYVALTTITLDEILAERGRELAWEFHRRQDLIRFDKFTQAWQFKPASAETRELYPIPRTQLDLNPNLSQNPGY